MNQQLLLQLTFSLFVGLLLGSLFFGGLWLTVKHLQRSTHPALLFLASALARTLITLSGFWFTGVWFSEAYRWQRLGLCLAGFILARILFIRYARSIDASVPGKSV